MALTDLQCKNAKSSDTPVKLADGGGLYLLVNPNGSKWWRLKYRFQGKEKLLSLGVYPETALSVAREKREEAKKLLRVGICPSYDRQKNKLLGQEASENTFESISREWFDKKVQNWAPATATKVLSFFENDIFPWIGRRPIKEITAAELLAVIRRTETRGTRELPNRIRGYSGQVFRYAVATGRAERDPSVDLRGALTPVRHKHHASITEPKEVGALLRAIDSFTGSFVTKCALQLAPLVFVRPGELRHAEWVELDLEIGEWRIPGPKMKMKDKHIVPLSRQAVEIFKAIQPLTGEGKYVFPSNRTTERPMSENTVNAALRRLGYEKTEMTGHGFRSMASTLLHEQGWPHEAIERQLAHAERDSVVAAYNYSEHLPKRREMMQAWSDYLDELKAGGKVLTGKFGNKG